VVEVLLAEAGGAARVAADLTEQAPEALPGEGGLGDLPAAVGGPQLVVDAPVGGNGRAGAAEAKRDQGLAQRRPLGPVEVEERVVDVEEDGAQAGQAATWRGR
jgi:hypothetical protein